MELRIMKMVRDCVRMVVVAVVVVVLGGAYYE